MVDFAATERGVREIRRRSFGSLVLARGKESEGGRSVRIGGLEREGLSGEEIQAGGSVWPVSVGSREENSKGGGRLSGFGIDVAWGRNKLGGPWLSSENTNQGPRGTEAIFGQEPAAGFNKEEEKFSFFRVLPFLPKLQNEHPPFLPCSRGYYSPGDTTTAPYLLHIITTAPLTNIFFLIIIFVLLYIIINIYIGKIKNSNQY